MDFPSENRLDAICHILFIYPKYFQRDSAPEIGRKFGRQQPAGAFF